MPGQRIFIFRDARKSWIMQPLGLARAARCITCDLSVEKRKSAFLPSLECFLLRGGRESKGGIQRCDSRAVKFTERLRRPHWSSSSDANTRREPTWPPQREGAIPREAAPPPTARGAASFQHHPHIQQKFLHNFCINYTNSSKILSIWWPRKSDNLNI